MNKVSFLSKLAKDESKNDGQVIEHNSIDPMDYDAHDAYLISGKKMPGSAMPFKDYFSKNNLIESLPWDIKGGLGAALKERGFQNLRDTMDGNIIMTDKDGNLYTWDHELGGIVRGHYNLITDRDMDWHEEYKDNESFTDSSAKDKKMNKVSFLPKLAKKEKPGLWANIRAKRKRGEPPAKPGDKAYPDKEQWSNLTKKEAESFGDVATQVGVAIGGGASIGALGYLLSKLINRRKNTEPTVPAKSQKSKPIYGTQEDEDYVKNMTPEERGAELARRMNEAFGKGNWKIKEANDQAALPSIMNGQKQLMGNVFGHIKKTDPKAKSMLTSKEFWKFMGSVPSQYGDLVTGDMKGLSKTYNRFGANIKEGRCWGGYEPVPGKKPYTKDSCRPKSKKKNKNKKAEVSFLPKTAKSPAWQRSEGKNSEGGLNEKGRKSYNRETGGNLKAPVTEKNPSGKREKRQNSFCSRMCGMKRSRTSAKTKNDPDSRINKALRKWRCRCS